MTSHESQSEILPEPEAVPKPVAKAGYWLAGFVDRISERIAGVIAARPLATRATLAAFMVVGLVVSFASHARAQGMQSEIDNAWNFSNSFDIFGNSIKLAEYIFATLAALTVMVKVLSHYIRNQSVQGLGKVILSSVLSLGLPFVIIDIAPKVVPMICVVGLQITGLITGTDNDNLPGGDSTPPPAAVEIALTTIYNNTFGSVSGASHIAELTPKSIVNVGVHLGWPLIQRAQEAIALLPQNPQSLGSNGKLLDYVVPLAIMVIGTWVFIAVELVVAYIQIYLVLPVAAFSLGFLGSPATRQFGSGYWVIVVQALVRFSTIVFIIGFAMSLAPIWLAMIGSLPALTAPTPGSTMQFGVFQTTVSVLAMSVSMAYIVRVLPSMFGAILTGMYAGADGNTFESQAGSMNATRSAQSGNPPGGKQSLPGFLASPRQSQRR